MVDFPFNVRVYGLMVDDNGRVLLVDEERGKQRFTKFPGGGLEFGEGTIATLKRECREEMNQEVDVISHFYTTDYFVPSAFNPKHQVLSIYYRIKVLGPVVTTSVPFDFQVENENEKLAFRWRKIADIDPSELRFPIDQVVLQKLKESL